MAREITIMTPEQVEVKFELAGIGSRCVAMIIDTLWQSLGILATIILPYYFGFGASTPYLSSIWFIIALVAILLLVVGGYFLYFEATRNGQTPGKKVARIRVVLDTGHPIDFRAALLRNVVRIVDMLPGSYGVAVLSVFFSPEYRRLGDYVGGTLVVRVGIRSEDIVSRPTQADQHSANFPNVIGETQTSLPPTDILPPEAMPLISTIQKDEYRAIRHFLDRRTELENQVAQDLSRKLAEPIAQKLKLDIATIASPLVFLETVSKEWERRIIH